MQHRLLRPLQLGKARQQPLHALAGESDCHLLVVLDQLRADDDAIAEGRVAHLLAGEERHLARPRRVTLRAALLAAWLRRQAAWREPARAGPIAARAGAPA